MEGQPDNFDNEDCVVLVGYSHGQWRDEKCNTNRKFICKHPNGELVTVILSVSVLVSNKLHVTASSS